MHQRGDQTRARTAERVAHGNGGPKTSEDFERGVGPGMLVLADRYGRAFLLRNLDGYQFRNEAALGDGGLGLLLAGQGKAVLVLPRDLVFASDILRRLAHAI